MLPEHVPCRVLIHEGNERKMTRDEHAENFGWRAARRVNLRVLFGDDLHVVDDAEGLEAVFNFRAGRLENGKVDRAMRHGSLSYFTREILHEESIGHQLTSSRNFRIVQFVDEIQMILVRCLIAGRRKAVHFAVMKREGVDRRNRTREQVD